MVVMLGYVQVTPATRPSTQYVIPKVSSCSGNPLARAQSLPSRTVVYCLGYLSWQGDNTGFTLAFTASSTSGSSSIPLA